MRDIENVKDTILNALAAGMAYPEALLLSCADEEQTQLLKEDLLFQAICKQTTAALEKELLGVLRDTIEIQASKGKDHGVTWLLSKINPSRYGGGDDNNADNTGSIIINTKQVDLKDPDSAVEIFDGSVNAAE